MVAITQAGFRGQAPLNVQRTGGAGPMPVNQPQMPQQQVPQTGLIGAEQALQRGATSALDLLAGGQGMAMQQLGRAAGAAQASQVDPTTGQRFFTQAAEGVGAFSPAGLQAQQRVQALSGALGQEAFDQAMINNPAMQFLQEQGQNQIINQAAALGGLGGGNVQKELARFGQGLASQDLQRQIQNAQALSQQGLQAAGQQGQFLSQAGQQEGNLAATNAQLGTQAALARAGLLGQGAGITSGLTQQGANILAGTGQNIASGRTRAGEQIASGIGSTTSALSNLINQQGSGLSDIIGQGSTNVANILSGAGQLDANLLAQLAGLESGLATQQGTQLAGLQGQIGQAQAGRELAGANAIQGLLGQGLGLAALGGAFGQGGILGNLFRT